MEDVNWALRSAGNIQTWVEGGAPMPIYIQIKTNLCAFKANEKCYRVIC